MAGRTMGNPLPLERGAQFCVGRKDWRVRRFSLLLAYLPPFSYLCLGIFFCSHVL
jgi:hypothetical protein